MHHIVVSNQLLAILDPQSLEERLVNFLSECVDSPCYFGLGKEVKLRHFLALFINYLVDGIFTEEFSGHEPCCELS